LIETPKRPSRVFRRTARRLATGRTAHILFTGYLVRRPGKIKLLRESFNP